MAPLSASSEYRRYDPTDLDLSEEDGTSGGGCQCAGCCGGGGGSECREDTDDLWSLETLDGDGSGCDGYALDVGTGIGFDCRDRGREMGDSAVLKRSPDERGVTGFKRSDEVRGLSRPAEKGETDLPMGLLLPLL